MPAPVSTATPGRHPRAPRPHARAPPRPTSRAWSAGLVRRVIDQGSIRGQSAAIGHDGPMETAETAPGARTPSWRTRGPQGQADRGRPGQAAELPAPPAVAPSTGSFRERRRDRSCSTVSRRRWPRGDRRRHPARHRAPDREPGRRAAGVHRGAARHLLRRGRHHPPRGRLRPGLTDGSDRVALPADRRTGHLPTVPPNIARTEEPDVHTTDRPHLRPSRPRSRSSMPDLTGCDPWFDPGARAPRRRPAERLRRAVLAGCRRAVGGAARPPTGPWLRRAPERVLDLRGGHRERDRPRRRHRPELAHDPDARPALHVRPRATARARRSSDVRTRLPLLTPAAVAPSLPLAVRSSHDEWDDGPRAARPPERRPRSLRGRARPVAALDLDRSPPLGPLVQVSSRVNSVRTPKPVPALRVLAVGSDRNDGPAMSRCTHGVSSSTNSFEEQTGGERTAVAATADVLQVGDRRVQALAVVRGQRQLPDPLAGRDRRRPRRSRRTPRRCPSARRSSGRAPPCRHRSASPGR